MDVCKILLWLFVTSLAVVSTTPDDEKITVIRLSNGHNFPSNEKRKIVRIKKVEDGDVLEDEEGLIQVISSGTNPVHKSYKKILVPVYTDEDAKVQVYVAGTPVKKKKDWKGRTKWMKKLPHWQKPGPYNVKVAIYNQPVYGANRTEERSMGSTTSTSRTPTVLETSTPLTLNRSETGRNIRIVTLEDVQSIQTPLNQIRYSGDFSGKPQHKGLLYLFDPGHKGAPPHDVSKESFVPQEFVADLYSDFPDNFRSYPDNPDISEGIEFIPPKTPRYQSLPGFLRRPVTHSSVVYHDHGNPRTSKTYFTPSVHDSNYFNQFETNLYVPVNEETSHHYLTSETRREDSGNVEYVDTKKDKRIKGRRRVVPLRPQSEPEPEQPATQTKDISTDPPPAPVEEVESPSDATTISYYHEIQHGNYSTISTEEPAVEQKQETMTTTVRTRVPVSRGRTRHRMSTTTTERIEEEKTRVTTRRRTERPMRSRTRTVET